jgi:hypothetical protein
MSNYIKVSGVLWGSDDEKEIDEGDIELLNDVITDAVGKLWFDCDLDLVMIDALPESDQLESPWPKDRTLYDLDKEFDETGAYGAAEFEWMWLRVSQVIRDAALRAGVMVWDRRIRWLMFKVATGVCYWVLARDAAMSEATKDEDE